VCACLPGIEEKGQLKLKPSNVVFVTGHSHNVAKFLSGRKWWEGKTKTAGNARYVIYCSNKQDSRKTTWPSADIDLGAAHFLFEIVGYAKPGREDRPRELGGGKWPVEWLLRKVATLGPPFNIRLDNGVGRGALYPNDANPHLKKPFEEVKIWLTRHQVTVL